MAETQFLPLFLKSRPSRPSLHTKFARDGVCLGIHVLGLMDLSDSWIREVKLDSR